MQFLEKTLLDDMDPNHRPLTTHHVGHHSVNMHLLLLRYELESHQFPNNQILSTRPLRDCPQFVSKALFNIPSRSNQPFTPYHLKGYLGCVIKKTNPLFLQQLLEFYQFLKVQSLWTELARNLSQFRRPRRSIRQQSISSAPPTASFYSKSWQANDVGENLRGSWERSYVETEEVEELLRGCTWELKDRGTRLIIAITFWLKLTHNF